MTRRLIMNIKVLMFDLDGTLLTSNGIVSKNSLDTLKCAKEKGYHIGICTGREALSVKDLLPEWGLEGLIDSIVGTGGAEVLDLSLDVHETNHFLEGNLIKEIVSHYQDMDVNFAIPYNGMIYAPFENDMIKLLSKFDKIPYEIVDFDKFLIEPKPKIMIVCEEMVMDQVIERSKTFKSSQYKSASLKTASVLYEYMDPNISKTGGIQKILDYHNFTLQECCCFGDADNDFDMIKNAGIGVVMGNGSSHTKSVANYITDDNDHDGIANFINNILFKM